MTLNIRNLQTQRDTASHQHYQVLVVEDTPVHQDIAKGILEHLGHDYCLVDNAQSVIKMAKNKAFDLILVDIGLPDRPGDEIIRIIRYQHNSCNQKTPIIGLTANHDNFASRIMVAGADGICPKPLTTLKLLKIIEKWRK